jgi:GR25 family glycosyltransferase involved in LPS biosynthesis
MERSDINLDYDILKLEGRVPRKQTYFEIDSNQDKKIIAVFTSYGTAAYLITAAAARRVLERQSAIKYPFDDALFCNWRNGLTIYTLFPYPAKQSGTLTTISNRGSNNQTKLERHAVRIARIIPKKFDKLRRRVFQLRKFGLASFNQKRFDELTSMSNTE